MDSKGNNNNKFPFRFLIIGAVIVAVILIIYNYQFQAGSGRGNFKDIYFAIKDWIVFKAITPSDKKPEKFENLEPDHKNFPDKKESEKNLVPSGAKAENELAKTAYSGDIEAVNAMLAKGADVNAKIC